MLRKKQIVTEMMEVFSKNISDVLGEKVECSYKIIPSVVKVEKLKTVVEQVTGISFFKIKSNNRERTLVDARRLFCWFAFFECGLPKNKIAFLLGHHHTSVIHAIESMKGFIACNDETIMPFFKKIETEMEKP